MKVLKIEVGQVIDLSFDSLSQAGYLWTFQMEKTGIVVVTAKIGTLQKIGNVPGNSHAEIFSLQGLAPGLTNLIFIQKRTWEVTVNPAQVVEYIVAVT